MLSTKKEKATIWAMRVVGNMVGFGGLADSLWAMKFTTKTGEKFVQHCEKLQK